MPQNEAQAEAKHQRGADLKLYFCCSCGHIRVNTHNTTALELLHMFIWKKTVHMEENSSASSCPGFGLMNCIWTKSAVFNFFNNLRLFRKE